MSKIKVAEKIQSVWAETSMRDTFQKWRIDPKNENSRCREVAVINAMLCNSTDKKRN
jgi:hypothetical protein